jgi:phosphate:Na+ symporter
MGAFDTWRFLAGVGIFIFAMYLMEESIRELSGRAFKAFLRRYTGTRLRALLTGTVSTAILQSSSAVTLMLLAFVGAGLMTMPNAIGVILGSNLGTTFTAWIVATLGFKVEIENIALPLLGIGGLGIIFLGKSEKYGNVSKLLLGFGFLFLGLEHMKGSIEEIAGQINMADYTNLGWPLYVGLGILLTALMQSSSATLAVVLTALYAQIISFDHAAVMVIGSNVGTTMTILLGASGGGRIKWRVALSHVTFNVTTGILALIALPLLLKAVDAVIHVDQEPVLALALFHTFFNVLGVIIFLPFVGLLARLIMRWLPNVKQAVSKYVSHTTSEVVEPAITCGTICTFYE